jgi:hypothetical protein
MPLRSNHKARLRQLLADKAWPVIGAAELEQLSVEMPMEMEPLRQLLRKLDGLHLHPLVEGVRQDTLPNLERTLLALQTEYIDGLQQAARQLVLLARQHGEFRLRAAQRAGNDSSHAEETLLLLRAWLENPLIFDTWLLLRQRAATAARSTPP